MDKHTALIGALVFAGVFVIALLLLRRPTEATTSRPSTNVWDAIVGLGGSAADAYEASA